MNNNNENFHTGVEEKIIISLGGSLIIPEELDVEFLKDFKNLIISQIEKGKKFIIITGGGKLARKYNDVAKMIAAPSSDDLDWIGIATTRLNAELVRVTFGGLAYSKIMLDPNEVPGTDRPVILGGGWKPGNSSDLASIQSAISAGAKKVINLSNIDYVYTADPKKFPEAAKIEKSNWADFRKLLPESWDPGLNAPFDPIAAKKAQESGLEVAIMNGKNLENLEHYLNGDNFIGTIIS